MSASGQIWGTWVSRYGEPRACWKQWVLRRRKVRVEEESRMPDGSEFQTAGAATLKPRNVVGTSTKLINAEPG